MPLTKISSKTLRQRVYEQLKESITAAELLPGEKISIRLLAEKLGVDYVSEVVGDLVENKDRIWEYNKGRKDGGKAELEKQEYDRFYNKWSDFIEYIGE